MTLTVADVFRRHWSDYCKIYKPTALQCRVASAIMHCRTPRLGAHEMACAKCGYRRVVWNSCRNRHCPQCGGDKAAQWLEDRKAELLPVNYFHTVFTLPHALHPLARLNKKLVYSVLFKAASETLLQVCRKRFGGEIGFFTVLHTWGGTLNFHPHAHCVVPGCVITPSGIQKLGRFLVSNRVLSRVFRGKAISLLKRAYRKKKVVGQFDDFEEFLSKACKSDWVVRTRPPFAGPEVVLKYLSRYTQRIAISNKRLVSLAQGVVTFRYRDYKRSSTIRHMQLPALEFIRRFLQHVLPHHFIRLRHFGIFSRSKRQAALAKLRSFFACTAPALNPHAIHCPHCDAGELVFLRVISPKTLPFHSLDPPR